MSAVAAPYKRPRSLWKNARPSVLGGLVVALMWTMAAGAYWTAIGAGGGGGGVGTLAAPTLSGTPGAGTVALSWTAVTPPGGWGSVSYYVQRNGGDPGGDCPKQTNKAQVLTCTDTGLSKGTYTYTVTAVWLSWTATSSPATQVTLASGALDHFAVSAATTTPTAGQTDNLTITAQDAAGNTVTVYTGVQCLTFSGPGSSPNNTPPSYPPQGSCAAGQSAVTFANGVATPAVTLYKAETVGLVVSDGSGHSNGAGLSLTVSPAAINKLSLAAALTTVTAGQTDNLTITALDPYGNTATSYTGSHNLTFSGANNAPNGTQPTVTNSSGSAINFGSATAITFAAGVATVSGSNNGVMRLYKVETANITVNEGGSYTSSPLAVTVSAAALNKFSLAAVTTTPTAGVADNLTITMLDAYGNTVASYGGSHNLTFAGAGTIGANVPTVTNSSGTAISFGAATAITFTNGVATVSGSSNGVMRLYKVETANITVAEGTSYTSSPLAVTVSAAAISRFSLAAALTTVTAGQTDNLTITMLDAYGNTVTAYTGSHNLTFSGATTIGTYNPTVTNNVGTATAFGTATAITFTAGVATVSGSSNGVMTLYKVETANITVAEGGSYTSSPLAVTVGAATINRFSLAAALTTVTAGQTDNLTITALDTYGNTATSYAASHSLTFAGAGTNGTYVPTVTNSSGTAISFGAATAITFTNGVATVTGSNNGVMTLYKAETANITVNEGGNYTSPALAVTVNVGPMSKLSLAAALTTVTAGQADNLTITAQDAGGNTVTSYGGSHNLTFAGAGTIGANVPTVTNSSGTAVNFGSATAITFSNGVATVSGSNNGVMRLYKAETANITVNEGGSYTSSPLAVTVNAAAISRLSLAAATTTPTAGVADNLTITALDTYGNTATSYTGSHNLTFAGASVWGPFAPTVTNSSGTAVNFGTATPITFTNGVAAVTGSNNGAMTLYKAETANITVNEGGSYTSPALAVTVTAKARTVGAGTLAAGGFHTCVLMTYGGVECWGYNGNGQLGNGTTTNSSTPVIVSGLMNITQISAGKYHTCALRSDGTVWCWGLNDIGELGNNTTTNSSTPVQVVGVGGTGFLTGVAEVAAGGRSTCARLSSGNVTCWGDNTHGQLGDNTVTERHVPVTVVGVGGSGTLTGVSDITEGANHGCAVVSGGGVDCWGYNSNGQLGDNTTTDRHAPVQVHGVGNVGNLAGVASVSGGRYHTCALLSGGVDCWGYNNDGELGDGTTTERHVPVAAAGITTASRVSAGAYHTCISLADATARCWGLNTQGQVGDGTTTSPRNAPVTVVGIGGAGTLSNVTMITAGGGNFTDGTDHEHSAAVLSDGRVVSWGNNTWGQLGDGSTTQRTSPVVVTLQ